MEQACFFENGGTSLFGVLHSPSDPPGPMAFVMSHPFGEEKLWTHRVFVSFARALAARGHNVLRFDFAGTGDSGGDLGNSSLDSHVADLDAAIRYLADREPGVRHVGLVGLRFGATIAARCADSASGRTRQLLADAPLALWDPIINGEAWLQELLRSHLSTQLATHGKVIETRDVLRERMGRGERVNLDGYDLAAPLFDSCNRKDLLSALPKSHQGRALIMQISSKASQKVHPDLESLAASYRSGTYARCIEEPFWKEIRTYYGRAPQLQDATLRWLEEPDANV
jgi:exosortase A-associated hydrolase 2